MQALAVAGYRRRTPSVTALSPTHPATPMNTLRSKGRTGRVTPVPRRTRPTAWPLVMLAWFASPVHAHASLFHGETLDAIANGISWVAIIIAPVIGIAVFWMVHILPEKIAEKKKHPQTKAIQCVCLLSLVFGGLLWPLAWLWAYTKPVFYKSAYGTDVDETVGHEKTEPKNKKKGGEG